jgi:hypothetical protein
MRKFRTFVANTLLAARNGKRQGAAGIAILSKVLKNFF